MKGVYVFVFKRHKERWEWLRHPQSTRCKERWEWLHHPQSKVNFFHTIFTLELVTLLWSCYLSLSTLSSFMRERMQKWGKRGPDVRFRETLLPNIYHICTLVILGTHLPIMVMFVRVPKYTCSWSVAASFYPLVSLPEPDTFYLYMMYRVVLIITRPLFHSLWLFWLSLPKTMANIRQSSSRLMLHFWIHTLSYAFRYFLPVYHFH